MGSRPPAAGKSGETGQAARAGNDPQFTEVIAAGNRRASLEALRDKLATAMDEASSGVVPQIAAQLRATLKDIAELPDGKKVTTADDLRNRREARRAAAAALSLASGDGK